VSPTWYSVLVAGKWTTIRTCRGPIGAYRVVLGTWADNIKIRDYRQTGSRRWDVNDAKVIELHGTMQGMSAG
jgi:hypothetical protein